MNVWYWNAAGQRFTLPEQELAPPDAKTEGRATMASKKKIADMEEVNAFWSDVLRNEEENVQVRLKASELRAKAAGSLGSRIDGQEKTSPSPTIPLSRRRELLREIAERFGRDGEAPSE